jgi:hypothetical protein
VSGLQDRSVAAAALPQEWSARGAVPLLLAVTLLAEQRQAAAALLASGTPSLPVDGWWQLPGMQVLTDLPPSTVPGAGVPTVLVFTSIRAALETGTADARAYLDRCGEVLASSESTVVCRRPAAPPP